MRVAIALVALLVVFTVLISSVVLVLAKRGALAVIGQQQFAMVSAAADEIDREFFSKQAELQALAAKIPKESTGNSAGLQRYLEQNQNSGAQFDNFIILDTNGWQLANLNDPAPGDSANPGKRDFNGVAQLPLRGAISAPLRNPHTGNLMVTLTVPVRDQTGKVALILLGVVDLQKDGFLSRAAPTRIGSNAYFFIVTADGTIVAHPNKTSILKNVAAVEGGNSALERAFAGFEGSTEGSNRLSANGLQSFKRLKSVNWIVAAVYPDGDTFAASAQVEDQAILVAVLLVALGGPFAWWVARRQIIPLLQLRERIRAIGDDPARAGYRMQHQGDGIGDLACAFDGLLRDRLAAEFELRESRTFLQTLIDQLPAVIFVKDLRPGNVGKMLVWNKAAEEISGLPADKVIGKTNRESFPSKMTEILDRLDRQMLVEKKMISVDDYPYRRPDGDLRFLSSKSVPLLGQSGEPEYMLGIVDDVTERHRTLKSLRDSEQRLRTITDNLPVLIAYVDQHERYRFCNSHYEKHMRPAQKNLLGSTVREIIGEAVYANVGDKIVTVLAGQRVTYERCTFEQGVEQHWRVDYIPEQTADGAVVGFYVMLLNITGLKEIETQLRSLARLDPLTQLANRTHFDERLAETIERCRRDALQVALIYLDVDHFKAINDTLGHHGGDEVLREFSRRLGESVRQTDMVARLAGDEFVIILEGRDMPDDAETVATKIIHAMERDFEIFGTARKVSTSIGIAVLRENEADAIALLRRADDALYAAKSAGRNAFRCIA